MSSQVCDIGPDMWHGSTFPSPHSTGSSSGLLQGRSSRSHDVDPIISEHSLSPRSESWYGTGLMESEEVKRMRV